MKWLWVWVDDLALKIEGDVGWFFNFNEDLLVSVVADDERFTAPVINPNRRHDQHIRANLQKWLRHHHIDNSTEVRLKIISTII